MGYYLASEDSHSSCLDTITDYSDPRLDMTEGNDDWSINGWNKPLHSLVMDMMERSLGVEFTSSERSGELMVAGTPRQLHLMMLPFRIFMENGNPEALSEKMFASTPDLQWGTFIALHCVYPDTNRNPEHPNVLRYGFYSDQQWFLHAFREKASTEGIIDYDNITWAFNHVNLVKRVALLFPVLNAEMSANDNIDSSTARYNMCANGMTLLAGSPLHGIASQLRDDWESANLLLDYDGEDNAPEVSDDAFRRMSQVLNTMFHRVHALAVKVYAQESVVPACEFALETAPLLTEDETIGVYAYEA